MELNPKAEVKKESLGKDMTVNKEGAVVWKDDPFRAVILGGMSLNLRPRRTFYYSDEERFNEFVASLEEVYKRDPEFLEALIPYLRLEHGRKLSPVVTMGFLLAKAKTEGREFKHLPRFIDARVVDTPKRMAEVVAVYRLLSGEKTFASVPHRERFKAVLESYDAFTLKKNRMRRRKIKLADLIKVFRPKPRDEEMSRLYKAIIENDPYASLKSEEHVTATLSSTELSREEKRKVLEENVGCMPFNALVRNLSQFVESPLDVKVRIRKRFVSVLAGLKKGDERVIAAVNPFDLLALPDSPAWKDFGMLQDVARELVDSYVDYWRERLGTAEKKAAILLDISGSMASLGKDDVSGIVRAVRFLGVLGRLYDVVRFGAFDTELYLERIPISEDPFWGRRQSEVNLEGVVRLMREKRSAFNLVLELKQVFQNVPFNGTALVDAYKAFVKAVPDADLYVLVTDEVTWADRSGKTWELEFLPKTERQKVMVVNVDYAGRTGGVVVKHPQVLRVSELTPGVFGYLEVWEGDIGKLVEKIKAKWLRG